VRREAISRGWRGSGWLLPVEAVGGVAWTKSSMEEGFRRPETVSTSPSEGGWICVFGEVLARKGNGGDVSVLSLLRDTEGEERKGWWGSGAGGATWRKEEGRPGLDHAMRRRTAWGRGGLAGSGAGRGAWPVGAGGPVWQCE
jgi:hypothetical protein